MPELRTLKLIVGGMTLLIFIMLGAVIWGISQKARLVSEGAARFSTSPPPSAAPWQISLPEGQILAVTSAADTLAVLSETPQGRRIYVFDPRNSQLLGTISGAAPAP